MTAANRTDAAPVDNTTEKRFLLRDVSWGTYVALRSELDAAGSHVQLTYLEGALELMATSGRHEELAGILGYLFRVWAEENDVAIRGFGGMTFRHKARRRGLEGDECYTLGRTPTVPGGPDLAIEVVVASPLLDKLDVYAGLRVPEVWVWNDRVKRLTVHVLVGGRYEARSRSALFHGLDLVLLASFVKPGKNHTALAKAFRAAIRQRGASS